MELKELTFGQLVELTQKTDDKEALREIATHVGASFSGNTGVAKLKENILVEISLDDTPDVDEDLNQNDPVAQALIAQNIKRAEEEKDEDVHVEQVHNVYSRAEMLEMDATKVKDDSLRRKVIQAQALRLRRVRIINNDPKDANVPGSIITVNSKYTGKVSKFISYEEEFYDNGYHVPQILLDDLITRTYPVRRKKKDSKFGVNQYTTVYSRKFMIEYLPDLTPTEIKALAQDQAARNAIDRTHTK